MAEQRTASLVVCIDATSLAVLQLSREGASRWAWPDSSPLRPTGKPGPARKAALDRSRRELEAEAVAEFAEAGGGTSAESLAWRQVFVRRRLALVVSGALGALSGVAAPEPESATAALTRKKDAPEHGDAEGVRRFLAAQAEQSALADRRCARGRPRRLVASAARPLQGGRCCWEVAPNPNTPNPNPSRSRSTHPHPIPSLSPSPSPSTIRSRTRVPAPRHLPRRRRHTRTGYAEPPPSRAGRSSVSWSTISRP